MASATPVQQSIEDGPAEYKFKIGYWERKPMEFTLKGGKKIICFLNGVEFEDGSGEHFLLKGYIQGTRTSFSGYYDLKHKAGYIKF